MNITTLNSRNSRPNGPAALEERLAAFGRLALLKTAGALVTTDRGVALLAGTTLAALPFDEHAGDDEVAEALDRLASMATVVACELRGTTTEATS